MIHIDTANHIAARAAMMARPRVAAAYPITPQTTVVERLAQHVENGEVDMEFIRVESEHSAMTACIGAAAMGVRTFTATASHGLLLMHEMLHWAGLARLPIVMVNINRAIGPGWNIWSDQNDSLSQRDTGWIQLYASSNQEVFDYVIQAYKIAEHPDVMLPVMISYDGFILSHTSMPVDVPPQEKVDAFIPPYTPGWKLSVEHPTTHGNIVSPEPYMEIRYDMHRAMQTAKKVIAEVGDAYGDAFGRYHGVVDEYRCDDADYVFVTLGAMAAEAHHAVDRLRERGERAGLCNLRTYRPFPFEHLNYDKMIVIDRNISPGLGGIIYHEMRHLPGDLFGFIAGIGGVDVTYKDIERIYALAQEGKQGWYPTEVN
jgi:pyruvate/2-oxoacid:ferredoxin oxidoreductase alpha subunit